MHVRCQPEVAENLRAVPAESEPRFGFSGKVAYEAKVFSA
jgi:hypothetical protein